MDLNVQQIALEQLVPYARNARTHSESQVAQIAGSIAEFGFVNPVLIGGDNIIIAGHGRVMAAKKLDLQTVPTIKLDHLTETSAALVIADNKIAENAGWDEELLRLNYILPMKISILICWARVELDDFGMLNDEAAHLMKAFQKYGKPYKPLAISGLWVSTVCFGDSTSEAA